MTSSLVFWIITTFIGVFPTRLKISTPFIRYRLPHNHMPSTPYNVTVTPHRMAYTSPIPPRFPSPRSFVQFIRFFPISHSSLLITDLFLLLLLLLALPTAACLLTFLPQSPPIVRVIYNATHFLHNTTRIHTCHTPPLPYPPHKKCLSMPYTPAPLFFVLCLYILDVCWLNILTHTLASFFFGLFCFVGLFVLVERSK